VRRGRRFSTPSAVCYRIDADVDGPLFGVVVSKQVGNAVVRNRVRRRIQAICAQTALDADPGQLVVVRALPSSCEAEWDTLRAEIGGAVRRAVMAG
jgi:ribonuclease P protein component